MANKTAEEVEAEIRAKAADNQTPEERARQEFERGINGSANRANEDIERMRVLGADPGVGGPPATEEPTPLAVPVAPAPTADNVMYMIPLTGGQVPVGPAIVPHPTKTVVDAMGVKLPPLPADVDPKTVFLVGGKWVNHDGIEYDKVSVKSAEERLADQRDQIAQLELQIATMKGGKQT